MRWPHLQNSTGWSRSSSPLQRQSPWFAWRSGASTVKSSEMEARSLRRLIAVRPRRLRLKMRHLGLPVLSFVPLALIAGPVEASAASSGGPDGVEGAATAIERQLEEMGVAQAAYVVISGEQQQVAGFGAASGDTPFVIGSVSKSLTALSILQLVDS